MTKSATSKMIKGSPTDSLTLLDNVTSFFKRDIRKKDSYELYDDDQKKTAPYNGSFEWTPLIKQTTLHLSIGLLNVNSQRVNYLREYPNLFTYISDTILFRYI